MKDDSITQFVLLFVVCSLFWLFERNEHISIAANSEKQMIIKVPKWLGMFFGVFNSTPSLHIRGIVGQVFSILLFVFLWMYTSGNIEKNDYGKYLLVLFIIVVTISGGIYFIAKRFWS